MILVCHRPLFSMIEKDADRRAELIGGHVAKRRRGVKGKNGRLAGSDHGNALNRKLKWWNLGGLGRLAGQFRTGKCAIDGGRARFSYPQRSPR